MPLERVHIVEPVQNVFIFTTFDFTEIFPGGNDTGGRLKGKSTFDGGGFGGRICEMGYKFHRIERVFKAFRDKFFIKSELWSN